MSILPASSDLASREWHGRDLDVGLGKPMPVERGLQPEMAGGEKPLMPTVLPLRSVTDRIGQSP